MNSQFWIWVGVIFSCVAIGGFFGIYRFYKHIGRRCVCGEIYKNEHVCKIHIASVDDFHPYLIPDTLRRLYHAKTFSEALKIVKKFKWWIRNAETIVFAVCPCCEGKPSHIKVVTVSSRPISLWHLYWVWFFDRGQFYDTPELNRILQKYWRDRWHNRPPENNNPENPGFKITLS